MSKLTAGLLTLFGLGLALFLCIFDGFFVFGERVPKPVRESGYIEKGSVGAYLINLDRSPDRLKSVEPLLAKLTIPWHRVPAVDGRLMRQSDFESSVDLVSFQKIMGRLPGRGEVACALSHLKAWRTFLMSSYEFAIIFEDDVRFEPLSLNHILKKLVACGGVWDFCNLDIREKGERLKLYTNVRHLGMHDLRLYYQGVYCGDAYIVSRKAVRRLLARALPLVMTIEDYFARGWEFGMNYMALYPRAVYQQDVTSVLAAQAVVEPSNQQRLPQRWARFCGRIYRLKTGCVRAISVLKSSFSLSYNDRYSY